MVREFLGEREVALLLHKMQAQDSAQVAEVCEHAAKTMGVEPIPGFDEREIGFVGSAVRSRNARLMAAGPPEHPGILPSSGTGRFPPPARAGEASQQETLTTTQRRQRVGQGLVTRSSAASRITGEHVTELVVLGGEAADQALVLCRQHHPGTAISSQHTQCVDDHRHIDPFVQYWGPDAWRSPPRCAGQPPPTKTEFAKHFGSSTHVYLGQSPRGHQALADRGPHRAAHHDRGCLLRELTGNTSARREQPLTGLRKRATRSDGDGKLGSDRPSDPHR